MDICFRAKHYGYKVYCFLADVENKSFTMANYSKARAREFDRIIKRNSDIFYSRWMPSKDKSQFSCIHRIPICHTKKVHVTNGLFEIDMPGDERSKSFTDRVKSLYRQIIGKKEKK